MTLLRECIELFCLSVTSVHCLLPSQGVSQYQREESPLANFHYYTVTLPSIAKRVNPSLLGFSSANAKKEFPQ